MYRRAMTDLAFSDHVIATDSLAVCEISSNPSVHTSAFKVVPTCFCQSGQLILRILD